MMKLLEYFVNSIMFVQINHADFHCTIQIEDKSIRVPARIEGGRYVVCDETSVRFTAWISVKLISNFYLS